MILTTYVLKRYNSEVQTSEMFSTAGRTVKSGLVASAVVSSWTWAATLLQSSGVAYRYGVSGPFWYASGATVQILLFATLAIELKKRAPNAHTFLEVIRARYGVYGHLVFTVFGLMTNILVTAMLLTGTLPFHYLHYESRIGVNLKATVSDYCRRRLGRCYFIDRHAYGSGMLSTPCRSRHVHHCGWHQGNILDRLCPYSHDPRHHLCLRRILTTSPN